MSNAPIGSAFGEFLDEAGIGEEVTTHAIERVSDWLAQEGMSARALAGLLIGARS